MKARTALAACAFVASIACGSDSGRLAASMPAQFTSPAYSCSPGGTAPPTKLILHPSGGVPDQFIVVLIVGVNVAESAATLAARYDGQVLAVYEAVLGGFAVRMSATNAAALANEPTVCWVEQDAVVSGDV